MLVCLVAPASLVAAHMYWSPAFSTQDEVEHLDYVQRVASGSIPRLGQQMLPASNRLLRCIGRPPPGFIVKPRVSFSVPPCHGASRDQLARFFHSPGDAQYEAQQPPLYYAVTAVLRWPLIHVIGMSVLPGTRATGAIWLAAGLLLFWLAAAIVGLDWPMRAAGALFITVAPTVVLSASIVGNDAAAVFAGGLVAAVGAVAWRRPGALPWWAFAAVGLVVAELKASSVAAVVTVAALLLLHAAATLDDRIPGRALTPGERRAVLASWLPAGGSLLLGAAFGVVAWSIGFHLLSEVDPRTFAALRLNTDGQTGLADLASNATTMLYPFTNSPINPFEWHRWTSTGLPLGNPKSVDLENITAQITAALGLAVGFSALFVRRREWPQWLGGAALLALFVGGLLLGVSIELNFGYNTQLPGRYGLSTGVLLALALVGAFRGRRARLLFGAFSLATYLLTFAYILA